MSDYFEGMEYTPTQAMPTTAPRKEHTVMNMTPSEHGTLYTEEEVEKEKSKHSNRQYIIFVVGAIVAFALIYTVSTINRNFDIKESNQVNATSTGQSNVCNETYQVTVEALGGRKDFDLEAFNRSFFQSCHSLPEAARN